MKKCTLRHDDAKGFILVDEDDNFLATVDVGEDGEEVDWSFAEKQANKIGYTLD